MAHRWEATLDDGRQVKVASTTAADGDFQVDVEPSALAQRRSAIVGEPWSWLRQVHGAACFHVSTAGEHAGMSGDGLVTVATGCPISVTTADCAPVVLVAELGVAVAHAGWMGLEAGVVQEAAEMLRSAGGEPRAAWLGPCISPSAYAFGPDLLERFQDRYGPDVLGSTADGGPALDVPSAVAAACREAGWPAPERPPCTSGPEWFSHRTRADAGRMATVAWIENADG